MSKDLSALKLFIRAARTGSFSRAGRELRLSQSTVSRIIAQLEAELEVGLFTRTTRVVSLTDAGAEYLARIEPIIDALEEANHAIRGATELRGSLRVGLSSSFAVREIIPRLAKFAELHPVLHIELLVNDQRQDLVLEGVDLAIRLGPLPDSSAVAKKITTLNRIVAASPRYLASAGAPKHPGDLSSHRLISGPTGVSGAWTFKKGGRVTSIKVASMLSVSLNEGAIAAAVAGSGIVSTGMSDAAPELLSGTLVRLLPDWEMERIQVHAIRPRGRNAKPAARVFTEFLVAELST